MNVVIAYIAGCFTAWVIYKLALRYGGNLIRSDRKFFADMAGRFTYDQLLSLKSQLDEEIAKRKVHA